MKPSSLRVLLEHEGEIQFEGLPKALEGVSGKTIRKQLQSTKQIAAWQMIGGRANEEVLRLLDADLVPMLMGVWGKYRVLAEFADPKRHPPEEINEVALADHTFSATYRPHIQIVVDGVGRGSIPFKLTVEATVQAVLLTVQAGRITEIGSGSCSGKVRLDLDDAKLLERSFPEVHLPEIVELGDGLRIPVLGAEPDEGTQPVAARELTVQTS
jgi:hypothetical protein